MCIVETNHFKDKWAKRVGSEEPRLCELINSKIKRGEAIRHRRGELGILVPIQHRGVKLGVVGLPTKGMFILRTVLDANTAFNMGWGLL